MCIKIKIETWVGDNLKGQTSAQTITDKVNSHVITLLLSLPAWAMGENYDNDKRQNILLHHHFVHDEKDERKSPEAKQWFWLAKKAEVDRHHGKCKCMTYQDNANGHWLFGLFYNFLTGTIPYSCPLQIHYRACFHLQKSLFSVMLWSLVESQEESTAAQESFLHAAARPL